MTEAAQITVTVETKDVQGVIVALKRAGHPYISRYRTEETPPTIPSPTTIKSTVLCNDRCGAVVLRHIWDSYGLDIKPFITPCPGCRNQ